MQVTQFRWPWTQLLGIGLTVVWLGLSPTQGWAGPGPTLPTGTGTVFLDLNPASSPPQRDPVPFSAPFNPVSGGPCSFTASRGSCFFIDSLNSADVWHWETTITNTGSTDILNLPVTFSAGTSFLASGLLSLSPGSTALFEALVNDSPETSTRQWITNISGTGLPSFSIDTAIWEPSGSLSPGVGTLANSFFTGPADNFVFAPPTVGGLDFCIVEGDVLGSALLCSDLTSIPEPSTLALVGTGLLGWLGFWRRRKIAA